MATQRNGDSSLLNQFVLFYTLRQLWKLNERPVGELYKILFPSKNAIGGNKTLYDNILKGQVSDELIAGHGSRLEELTGLSRHFFTGLYELSIPSLIGADWYKFIQLRKKPETAKTYQLKEIEQKIKIAIRNANNNPSSSGEPLKRLIYFAEYAHKKVDKTLEDLFREIESKIGECRPSDFEKASLDLLEAHQTKIQNHLYHIAAVVTVKKWKQNI